MEGLGGEGLLFFKKNSDIIKLFLENWINMINDHKIHQKHLTYFEKTFYIVCNLKNKSETSPPFPS